MKTRSIDTTHHDSVCEVCGRTLLRGEQTEAFLAGGRRFEVCELCKPRALHEGWIREGTIPDYPSADADPPRRGGLFRRRRGAVADVDTPAKKKGRSLDDELAGGGWNPHAPMTDAEFDAPSRPAAAPSPPSEPRAEEPPAPPRRPSRRGTPLRRTAEPLPDARPAADRPPVREPRQLQFTPSQGALSDGWQQAAEPEAQPRGSGAIEDREAEPRDSEAIEDREAEPRDSGMIEDQETEPPESGAIGAWEAEHGDAAGWLSRPAPGEAEIFDDPGPGEADIYDGIEPGTADGPQRTKAEIAGNPEPRVRRAQLPAEDREEQPRRSLFRRERGTRAARHVEPDPGLRQPRQVHAIPTEEAHRAAAAVNAFNDSEHCRTIAGVARSLGAPVVNVTPDSTHAGSVWIVVSWELCWYRYEVDISSSRASVRLDTQGYELSELTDAQQLANAFASAAGQLTLS